MMLMKIRKFQRRFITLLFSTTQLKRTVQYAKSFAIDWYVIIIIIIKKYVQRFLRYHPSISLFIPTAQYIWLVYSFGITMVSSNRKLCTSPNKQTSIYKIECSNERFKFIRMTDSSFISHFSFPHTCNYIHHCFTFIDSHAVSIHCW